MAFKLDNPPYLIDWTPVYRTGNIKGVNGETFMNGSIVLNKNITCPKQLENTLSHEKVHVKQIKDGHLSFDENGTTWKGKHYSPSKSVAQDKKQPWEAQAYREETPIT